MKPLGRNLKLWSIINRLPEFGLMLYHSMIVFRDPLKLWIAYIKGKKPKGNCYNLRNGMTIYLSDNDHDSITVMVIFCRREYGVIKPGSNIVDIGANIGVFTLYAVWCGAKKVLSVEPNNQSMEILKKNISINNLNHIVFPLSNAISSKDGEKIYILENYGKVP